MKIEIIYECKTENTKFIAESLKEIYLLELKTGMNQ